MRTTDDEFGTLLVWLPQDARACYQAISHARRRSIDTLMAPKSHLYLGIPHPRVLPDGLEVLTRWGFAYKTVVTQIQQEPRSDLPFDGYVSLVTMPLLFGVRGKLRTFAPGRRQTNVVRVDTHQDHSQQLYEIIETCSPGPFLEISENPPWRSNWKHWSWNIFMHAHTEENTPYVIR